METLLGQAVYTLGALEMTKVEYGVTSDEVSVYGAKC